MSMIDLSATKAVRSDLVISLNIVYYTQNVEKETEKKRILSWLNPLTYICGKTETVSDVYTETRYQVKLKVRYSDPVYTPAYATLEEATDKYNETLERLNT
jgi:hypothetical protein